MELQIFLTMQRLFQHTPTPIFVEIGCHRGEDTLRMLEYVPQAKIYAFEADPRNVDYIESHHLAQRFEFFGTAVGRVDGKAPFFLSSGHYSDPAATWTLSSSLKRPKVHLTQVPWCKFEQEVEVNVCTLDTFARTHGIKAIDFIWMDVQGAENDIIAGGQRILRNTRYIYTEYSNVEMYEGQANLERIVASLPGQWRIAELYDYDFVALLENQALLPAVPLHTRLKQAFRTIKRLIKTISFRYAFLF